MLGDTGMVVMDPPVFQMLATACYEELHLCVRSNELPADRKDKRLEALVDLLVGQFSDCFAEW